ncbi:MAG: hypothetical protein IKM94_01535, partial [Alphaproteobacteria bacterium]|nr:hypothetical protein [Alphaproteobacteria bacterium]
MAKRRGFPPVYKIERVEKMSVKRAFFSVFQKLTLFCCAIFFGFANAFSANLPSGYTELEYIESTGTQYIKTSLTTNDGDISVQAIYEPASFLVSGNYAVIFGVETQFQAGYDSTGHAYIGNAASTGVFFALNTKATINAVLSNSSSRGTYFVNGADTGLKRQLDADKEVWLFAANNSDSPTHQARGKMYKFVAIRNNTIIMNLVPAKRTSDGVLGMYDTVNNRFYTKQGTGDFTPGPVVGIHIATTAYNSARNTYGLRGVVQNDK